MRKYKLNILAAAMITLLFGACKKNPADREMLAEGRVDFELAATTDIVVSPLDIRDAALVSIEMRAAIRGGTSADVHYITFATDTAKIGDYREKYGSTAMLLPTASYFYYKPVATIQAGQTSSESAVLNVGYQTTLKPRSTYVLPLVIAAVDGQIQDPKSRRVVYYVFNTGDALYVDHTGYTLTATASSTSGVNAPGRAVDAATGTTYWASATTAALPQWIRIDFGRNVDFSGMDYFFPTAVTPVAGGYTTSAKIETSINGSTWTDQGTYPVDVNNTQKKQTINLPAKVTARYLRFNILAATPFVSGANTFSIGFVSGILLRN